MLRPNLPNRAVFHWHRNLRFYFLQAIKVLPNVFRLTLTKLSQRMMLAFCLLACLAMPSAKAAGFDGPADNVPDKVRRVPKLGIQVPDNKRQTIENGLADLAELVQQIKSSKNEFAKQLLPDVLIFHRAVSDALKFQEFFRPAEIDAAIKLLDQGKRRAQSLQKNRAPWISDSGLVVRGFVSKIDGSVQPYGLVIPKNYSHSAAAKYRLDVWFHGRGETLSEVSFLNQRQNNAGIFQPVDTIVLHPYGRYSNAFKFAGEVDVLEGIADVKSKYRVDERRISVRGFSMGGAACWQFAVHYPDRWFAANPGAGFSETPEFLKFFQKETLNPTWYEKKLWRMYDCNLWAENLKHCPTIAYSGENDIQKQAGDIMESALKEYDIDLVHLIGPQMGHRYHPESAHQVSSLLDQIAVVGNPRLPRNVTLNTYTLKYNRMYWLTVDSLREHWEKSRITGSLKRCEIEIKTDGITRFSINIPPGLSPFTMGSKVLVKVDDESFEFVAGKSDQSFACAFDKQSGRWVDRLKISPLSNQMTKQHGLQGPIDDALMDSFIFVKPSGAAWHTKTEQWTTAELERAIEHWRRHFRGHAQAKLDTEITEEDIKNSNLILWGDPSSNKILGKIGKTLPIQWTKDSINFGNSNYDSASHAIIMVYPNPLNTQKYVVLNSSFTFREFAYLNNARQVSKLPDWAIVDLNVAPDSLWPGKIVDANFFDERWQLKK